MRIPYDDSVCQPPIQRPLSISNICLSSYEGRETESTCPPAADLVNTRHSWNSRPYPYGWPKEKPEEKGIDVSLAVDFVRMAVQDEYNVGIIMSTDTDLKPALETLTQITDRRDQALTAMPGALSISGRRLWCHWLDEADYTRVHDTRDYNIV